MLLGATDYSDVLTIIEIVVASAVFITVISYIFKDNAAYKMLSHILLGAATAYAIYLIWTQALRPKWWTPFSTAVLQVLGGEFDPNVLWFFALVPGLMWYTLYTKKHAWMSRVVFGMFIGMGAGLAFKAYFLLIMPQVSNSFRPPVAIEEGHFLLQQTIKNVLFTVTLLTVLIYFVFTLRMDTPLVDRGRTFGRWTIMICFGALFGFTVMTRMSYFLERLNYVKEELIEGVLKAAFGG